MSTSCQTSSASQSASVAGQLQTGPLTNWESAECNTTTRPGPIKMPSTKSSISIFLFLQALDVLSTLIGTRLGAQESNFFISRLMNVGPAAGLSLAKMLAVFLVTVAFLLNRRRLIVFVNFWFAAVVTWNLAMIFLQALIRNPNAVPYLVWLTQNLKISSFLVW